MSHHTSTTDTPDLTPLVRQRHLDGILESLLQAAFETTGNITTVEDDNGAEYTLVVDDTSGGFIKATLWREHNDGTGDCTAVATVTLAYTLTPSAGANVAHPTADAAEVEAPGQAEAIPSAPAAPGAPRNYTYGECNVCGADACACSFGGGVA